MQDTIKVMESMPQLFEQPQKILQFAMDPKYKISKKYIAGLRSDLKVEIINELESYRNTNKMF